MPLLKSNILKCLYLWLNEVITVLVSGDNLELLCFSRDELHGNFIVERSSGFLDGFVEKGLRED